MGAQENLEELEVEDLVIEKDTIEEKNMNSSNMDYCVSSKKYKSQEIFEESEDMPEDLSVKHRTVSVQTDTFVQQKLEQIFEGFSHNQIKFFMEILSHLNTPKKEEYMVRNCETFCNLFEKGVISTEPAVLSSEPTLTSFHKEASGMSARTNKTHKPLITAKLNSQTANHSRENESNRSKESSKTFTVIESQNPNYSYDEEGKSERSNNMSRDKRLVMKMKIPLTVEDIINTPMEVFNDLVCTWDATEEQINLCRDIRRRGKNKIAAQNCRKRKLSQITSLETELAQARLKKEKILSERVKLLWMKQEWKRKLDLIEVKVLKIMGKEGSDWMLSVDSNWGVKATERLKI